MTTSPDAATQLARVRRARSRLVIDHTFFAQLALQLKLESAPCGTVQTDGRVLRFDPAWCADKSDSELLAVVAHEAMHCALCHPARLEWRNLALAQYAADYAVNPILVASGFKLPPEGLLDDRFPAGTAFETIYRVLAQERTPRGPSGSGNGDAADGDRDGESSPGTGNDYGGMGEIIPATAADGSPASKADLDELERRWKVALNQAAMAAKAQGKLPGGIDELISAMQAPQVDWRACVRDWLRRAACNDYSWQRPNVRHLAAGDYFPSLYTESCGPLLCITDTSGSVTTRELEHVCGELNDLLPSVRPEFVDVLYTDTRVAHAERFMPEDWPIKLSVSGRGGTHLAPAWEYVREQGIDPVGAIITTDLELNVSDLGEDPGYPVLVLSTGRAAPIDGPLPFGELVKVQVG
jgi:predicted metal-dependent peptidase